MITKTLNLGPEYTELFDDIRTTSHGAINVDNLDAFFGSIEEIAALDPKFLRLPLDEPLFDIDANTRKITVPNDFRANGISVQRDHLAEVIFFRIERYFDYTDLSTCNIVINWKMGSKEGKTTRFIKFEKVFTIDEVKSSYIIFGWPINDVVTEKSGQLTFAVEFFKTEGSGNDEVVSYRFNTLPASVNIKDGLIIDEAIESVALDNDILRTLVNSEFGEGTAAVGDIVWYTGNGNGLVVGEGLGNNIILQDFKPIVDLYTDITNPIEPISVPVDFYAKGYVDEGTKIHYTDENNVTIIEEPIKISYPRKQVTSYDPTSNQLYYSSDTINEPLTEEQLEEISEGQELWIAGDLDNSYKYYTMVDNALVEATQDDLEKWGTAEEVDLYITAAKITGNRAKPYFIKAQGYKNDKTGQTKIGNGEVKSTAIVTIPKPEIPTAINIDIENSALEDELDAGYSFELDENQNVIFLNSENKGTLVASAVIDNYGALQFNWKKQVRESSNSDDGFDSISTESIPYQKENSNSYEINEIGNYKVSVINFQNNEFSEEKNSNIIIASKIAGKITNVTPKWFVGENGTKINVSTRTPTYNSNASSLANRTVTVSLEDVVIEPNGQQGTLEYLWYTPVYEDRDGVPTVVDKVLIEGELNHTITIDGVNITLKGSSISINGGDFSVIPEVRNNCNGSIYTYSFDMTKPIEINDSAT